MKQYCIALFLMILFYSCVPSENTESAKIVTVMGPIDASTIGITLEHEHVLVDFIGAEKVKQPQYELNHALDSLLPYFVALKKMGVQTIMECTPKYIGRDVKLLQAISQETGLNILTNTGYYAAANKKFLPAHTYTESPEQLADRWINEWENGINGTAIKPGFIKLGVGKNHLDSTEQKIVIAGALTHLRTGLKIAIHTGGANPANDEIDILKENGVASSALIVVHSQNMSTEEQIQVARRGAWVSLDGVKADPESQDKYIQSLLALKKQGLLHKTLISQDAYWSVTKGDDEIISFKKFGSPYKAIFNQLIPNLKEHGFTDADIDQILIRNPAEAYQIEICKL